MARATNSLPVPGSPQDQHRRIRGRHRFGLLQDALQARILADNLLKVGRGLEFLFEIELLFRQSVLQFRDIPDGQSVIDGNGDLICHLFQEMNIFLGKSILAADSDTQCPEHMVAGDQRQPAR